MLHWEKALINRSGVRVGFQFSLTFSHDINYCGVAFLGKQAILSAPTATHSYIFLNIIKGILLHII
jgi:hypothetical protein